MSPKRSRFVPAGWAVVAWAALFAGGGSALILALEGADAEAMGRVLRFTARTSYAFFLAAFVAAPLAALHSGPVARWMRANRRQLGVSFAVSHAIHLAAIIRLGMLQPGLYDAVTLGLGGLGYILLALMTATSFNRTARMIGPQAWKALHKTGMYYLGFVFVATFAGRIAAEPLYAAFPLAFAGAWALRSYVARRMRSSPGERAAA